MNDLGAKPRDLVRIPGQDAQYSGTAAWQPAVLWIAGSNTLATRRARLSACRQFMRYLEGTPPAGIRTEHVLAWKVELVDRGLAPRTIRQRLLILSGFFEWAIREGHHPGPNPVARVELPEAGRDPVGIALEEDEVEDLVEAAGHPRDRAILRLLAAGGVRARELCDLQERDLHLVKIDGRLESASVHVRHGKGGAGRVLALDVDAAQALVQYLAAGPRKTGPTMPLFQDLRPGARKREISYSTLYRVVRDCAAAAGLGHLAPHDLRRTYATLALDLGEPAPQVSRQMGHKTMEQTVRYYRGGNRK